MTDYVYNSLGQLVEQTTPDGGKTVFYYNNKSQLRFSVNARQLAENHFSYTRYDNLGRVTEVGEAVTQAGVALPSKLEEMTYPVAGLRQVTRTIYSTPSTVSYAPAAGISLAQRHLQNRVSYSYLDADGDANTLTDRQSSYYSYDAHGNVEWLVQDIPGLETDPQNVATRRKHIRYEYDLISGKVLKVLYQEKTKEQFSHRYQYDEDNRLTGVETSKDGVIWEKDASYEYYRHGPLKRMEIGEDRIQGVDYTYTIHGWLKAINHPELNSSTDPGEDGQGIVPADAFGMALSYYQGDYKRTTGGLDTLTIQQPLANKSLYNGNIASWTSQTQKASNQSGYPSEGLTAEQYTYDELNRIKSSSFAVHNGTSWESKSDYATSYRYDGNGNILKLNRNAFGAALELDKLTYHYYAGTNKLSHVKEGAAPTANTEDIEEQPDQNYTYDGIGQLIHDEQDKTTITWTVYNKVSTVTKKNAQGQVSQLIEYGYDGSGNRITKKVTNKAVSPETVTTTYYVRDVEGNVLAIYENQGGAVSQKEVYLYGSSRLGVYKPISRTLNTTAIASRELGSKDYELTDHLGNVRAVVGDYRESGGGNLIQAALHSYYNYYAFGMNMPGRNYFGTGQNRFRFGGKEFDKEFSNVYDYGFRIYSPALGRFLSVDPLARNYPFLTPYQYATNRPIDGIDLDGLEYVSYGVKFYPPPGQTKWNPNDVAYGIIEIGREETVKIQTAIPFVTMNVPVMGPIHILSAYGGSWIYPDRATLWTAVQVIQEKYGGEWDSDKLPPGAIMSYGAYLSRIHDMQMIGDLVSTVIGNLQVSAASRASRLAPAEAAYEATVGASTSTNYRATFFAAHPELEGHVFVHHAVEQQVLTRYPGLFTEAEIHSLQNLRGIPLEHNNTVHLSTIRTEWNTFYATHPAATVTRQQVLDFATQVDMAHGLNFAPLVPTPGTPTVTPTPQTQTPVLGPVNLPSKATSDNKTGG